jgi:hypothetical protein
LIKGLKDLFKKKIRNWISSISVFKQIFQKIQWLTVPPFEPLS